MGNALPSTHTCFGAFAPDITEHCWCAAEQIVPTPLQSALYVVLSSKQRLGPDDDIRARSATTMLMRIGVSPDIRHPATQALEEQVEAELQAERAAAEAEADRVKAAIEEKRREREQVEAALRTAVRISCPWRHRPPPTVASCCGAYEPEIAVSAVLSEYRCGRMARLHDARSDALASNDAQRSCLTGVLNGGTSDMACDARQRCTGGAGGEAGCGGGGARRGGAAARAAAQDGGAGVPETLLKG